MILFSTTYSFTHKRYDYTLTLNKIERQTSIFSSFFKKPEIDYFYKLESADLGDSYDSEMNMEYEDMASLFILMHLK